MKLKSRSSHVVDLLFTIALFFVFAVSSLSVILISSNAYRQIQKQTEANYSARTSLTYIAQKIRQNDVGGQISLGTIDGQDSLILKKDYEGTSYLTYIYEYKGELKELFIKDGVDFSASDGKSIMNVNGFTAEQLTDNLYRFVTTAPDGKEYELVVGTRTKS